MQATVDRPVASKGEARGLAGLGTLPSFALPAASGGEVRSWDYKSRQPLVIWLAGSAPAHDALSEAATREPALQAEGAELLIIVQAPLQQAERWCAAAGLRGSVLADADGRVHARLAAGEPALMVVDRSGTVVWRAPADDGRPDFVEARSWLAYLNIVEPECGTCVPAWTIE